MTSSISTLSLLSRVQQELRRPRVGEIEITEALHYLGLVEADLRREAATDEKREPVALPLNGIKNGVRLEPDDIRFLAEQAGIGEGYDNDDAGAVVLWVGETVDHDDGQEVRIYGLNAYCVECPEEGSVCLKELPRPATAAATRPTGTKASVPSDAVGHWD